jgi:hypothetical protein
MKLLDQLVFDTTRTLPLLALTGVASATGLAVYLFTAWLLDISEARPLWQLLGRAGTLIFAAEKTVAETVSPPAAISQTSASLEEAGQKIS